MIDTLGELAGHAHGDATHAERSQLRTDALDSLLVGEEHLGAGVDESILDLGAGPPGIERHRNRTHRDDRTEGHDPFGVVTHVDRHAISGLHAIAIDEQRGHGINAGDDLGVGPALVLVDDEDVVGRLVAQAGEQVAQGGRDVAEHPLGATQRLDLDDLQRTARAGEERSCIFECHRHGSTPSCSTNFRTVGANEGALLPNGNCGVTAP